MNKRTCQNCKYKDVECYEEPCLTCSVNTFNGLNKPKWEPSVGRIKVHNSTKFFLNYEKVIFNPPATIVIWKDGSKTVVKCTDGETFDPEKGLAMALLKKILTKYYYRKIGRLAKEYIEECQLKEAKNGSDISVQR